MEWNGWRSVCSYFVKKLFWERIFKCIWPEYYWNIGSGSSWDRFFKMIFGQHVLQNKQSNSQIKSNQSFVKHFCFTDCDFRWVFSHNLFVFLLTSVLLIAKSSTILNHSRNMSPSVIRLILFRFLENRQNVTLK